METRPFAGFNTRPSPSPWGYNWTTENISSTDYRNALPAKENGTAQGSPMSTTSTSSPEPPPAMSAQQQYANLPAALLTSLKRDKKPFTYTPGGVNLSEVLNARLQKRMERKKKFSEEREHFEAPPKQVIVMPTYNSPLDMYSMENAIEALEMQAGLTVADNSLATASRSATLPRNHTFRFDEKDFDSNRAVAQSKAFKVLQIITDTEEDLNNKGRSHHQDEMRFTGIRDSKSIPSKFFQTLQKITGTEEDGEEEEADPRNRTQAEPFKVATFDKQPPRPGFLPQAPVPPAAPPQQRVQSHQNMVLESTNSPSLRRPASFLPMKTGSDRFKPVHPPFLTNGTRKGYGPSGMSDF